LNILENNELKDLSERFLQLAYDSHKWKKWMLPDTRASDRDRAIIAGHYVFSCQDCISLKQEASSRLESRGINIDMKLKEAVKKSIQRYLYNFRLIKTL
jgi:hypothetical protein